MPVALVATSASSGDAAWVDTSTLGGLTEWTEDGSGNLYPNTTNAQELGSTSNQIETIYTRSRVSQDTTVQGTPSVTLGSANAHNVIAQGAAQVTSDYGTGSSYGTPALVFGNGYGANAYINGAGIGHIISGEARSFGVGVSTVEANSGSQNCMVLGVAAGFGTSALTANAAEGSATIGSAVAGAGASSTLASAGYGSVTHGLAYTPSAGSASTISSSTGSFVGGVARSYGFGAYTTTIRSTAYGGIAHGFAYNNGTITVSGIGGGMAVGYVTGGNAITASARGAIAMGNAASASIVASADGAIQLGVGTNAVADSIGLGPLRVLTTGTGTSNGEFWLAAGNVYCRSGGATRNLSNIP